MTALGNVMALVRDLDDREPTGASGDLEPTGDFPPPAEDASSLGELLAFIREIQRDSLRELIDSLPPVKKRAAAIAPD